MKYILISIVLTAIASCTSIPDNISGNKELSRTFVAELQDAGVDLGGSDLSCKYGDTSTFNYLQNPDTLDYNYFITVATIDFRNYQGVPPYTAVDLYKEQKQATIKQFVGRIKAMEQENEE